MKTCKLLFLLMIPLGISLAAYAQTLYGVNITASLGTEVITPSSSGTTGSLHNVAVTDKTITAALFATGTTGAAKASDLALAYDGNEIVVINTNSSNAVISTIAQTGSNASPYLDLFTGKLKSGAFEQTLTLDEVESDWEFSIPGQQLQTTAARIIAKFEVPASVIKDFSMSFMGGSITGSNSFVGIIKQNSKVY